MRTSILFFIFLFVAANIQAQTKHALLIGIGDYDASTNWSKLNSLRDVELVKKTMERKGFGTNAIATLTDAGATRDGIIAAMKKLTATVKPNSQDVVYIHVSSHGAQLEDDNGDETDGLDEAIVTINAKWTDDPAEFKKVAANYLRDDEFGDLIEQLRAKLGKEGDVAVFMDLCHSGTATRGELVARGNKSPVVSAGFQKKHLAGDENLKEFREKGMAARGDNSNLATYVVFSAARAEEAAYETKNDEGQKMGALTYAVCKSLENLSDSTTSYRALFASIEAIMDVKSNIQHPVVEGSGIDRGFLGGKVIFQKPYVEVESVDPYSNTVKIKAGLFSGLDAGTVVSFYPSGTADPDKTSPIGKGKITTAAQFSADVNLEKEIAKNAKDLWAFVTEPVFKIKPIVLRINEPAKRLAAGKPVFNEQESKQLKERLQPLKLFSYGTENADLILVKGEEHDSLLIANNGYLFATTAKKPLEEQLKTYAKYKYLKELVLTDPSLKVEVKLGKLKDDVVEFLQSSGTAKGYEYKVGEKMIIAVKNNGAEDIFINVLDFQPDGIVNPIFPNKSLRNPIHASELKVPAGKEIVFKNYQITIGPPLGSEVLKIFISDTEIDMEGVTKGFKSRNMMSALEGFVSESPEFATRGGDVLNLKEAKGAVFNIPFQIKAR